MALDNIRQRLELAYGGLARLETRSDADGFTAELRAPMTAGKG